jgi:ribosomal protein S18 acetylase RimI-like enzyme
MMSETIEPLSATPSAADLADLSMLLRNVVEGGASIGFMLPLAETEVMTFWSDVVAGIASDQRLVFVARDGGRIIGSVQLALAPQPNGRHRAELQKLLVHRSHRRRGLGAALIRAAESAALARGRTLIVLDSGATGNALGLYDRGGYIRAGVIPRFAAKPDGPLIDTVIYYKELA